MIQAGLTGGIGAGKSLVAGILQHLKVPVYHADLRSKLLLQLPDVKAEIQKEFGISVFNSSGEINRKKLADLVFNDNGRLQVLNAILHPRVRDDFFEWHRDQERAGAQLIVHEAAILLESGFDRFFDKIIVVTAPIELCIQRVIDRDKVSREQVLQRMKMQWSQEMKSARADYLLNNDGQEMLLPQVLNLYHMLNA